MGRLFGTDGIRGIAGSEITPYLAYITGKTVAAVLKAEDGHKLKILMGQDTRLSCDMIASALASGLCSAEADVYLCGVITTPGVAYLVSHGDYDGAFMISASHNSFEYNGIKIFDADGYKLDDTKEEKIEELILNDSLRGEYAAPQDIGRIYDVSDTVKEYIDYLKNIAGNDIKALRIAADCSNGSTYRFCRDLFGNLGCGINIINDKPDGKNINSACGSTDIRSLCEFVKSGNYDIGLAFDGDGDRLIATDEKGNIIDGDKITAICAAAMKLNNSLSKNTVAATVMSNTGFVRYCNDKGIACSLTDVGDRNVLECMLKNGYNLGGEQSGHIIFSDYATTGDGLLTAIQLLKVISKGKSKLSEISDEIILFPQITENIKLKNLQQRAVLTDNDVKKAIEDIRQSLGNNGNLIVRLSGTEPLIRVTVETDNSIETQKIVKEIAGLIRQKLI